MFRNLREKMDHKIHVAHDHTNVTILAHNTVKGIDHLNNRRLGRETIMKYVSETNRGLWVDFCSVAAQCGVMSENNLGEITQHDVDFTIQGVINGHNIPETKLLSIYQLSELIKSCGVETKWLGKDTSIKPSL